MAVDPRKAKSQSSYGGRTYYFCSASCKESFDREPEKHAKSGG